MSIVVSVKVRDGIVLGADGMTQIFAKGPNGSLGVAQTYENARKLFQVLDRKVGVMTYGAGNIGRRSIQGIIEDFNEIVRMDIKISESVGEIAKRLRDHINNEYNSAFGDVKEEERPIIGLYIGGYSKGSAFPEEWEFILPKIPEPKEVRPKDGCGSSWRGVTLPFSRLYNGIDPRIIEELKAIGIDKKKLQKIIEKYKCEVAYDAMPLQDAVNFAYHILRVTVDHTKFELGPPACGGPLEISVITKAKGFQQITSRKLTVQEIEKGGG